MEPALNELFSAFNLSQREQLVFETLLRRGAQPASRVAKVVSLPRNTTRNILDRLMEHGLVARSKRSNSHLYRVESLLALKRNLSIQLQQYERRIKKQLRSVATLEPLFNRFVQSPKKPMVHIYEGLDGAERVYEDTLTAKETIRAWASFDANTKALPHYFQDYYRRRASRGIHLHSIHPDTPLARQRMKCNRAEKRKCVLLPESDFAIRPEVQVYDNKINLVSWEDRIGILIESAELAEGLKNIFDLCFALAVSNQCLEKPKKSK